MSPSRDALRRNGGGAALVAAGLVTAALAFAATANVGASAPAKDFGSGIPASEVPSPASPRFPGVYAFVDVNVVPMDRREILEHQTVLVRNGVIRAMGDVGAVAVPEDAMRIEGDGRYLLPGLGDMQARLPSPEDGPEELEDLLFLYVAHGVTTIRQAVGLPGHRSLKLRLLRDQLLGPTLYVSSPPLRTGAPGVPDSLAADSVEAAVRRVAGERWDLLRVSEGMSLREWNLMTGEVLRYGLAFGGPVPDSVGLSRALASGISTVEHLDGLLEAVVDDRFRRRIDAFYAPTDTAGTGAPSDSLAAPEPVADSAEAERTPPPPLDSLVRAVVPRRIWAVAGRARAAGTWSVPTLRLSHLTHSPGEPDSLLSLPELRYMPREVRGAWLLEKQELAPVDTATARLLDAVRGEAVQALNDLNAGLLVGTDSPRLFNVPGASMHRELRLMREAGIQPYEVLIAATRNVARYASTELGESSAFGTVAEGNRADLLLVEDDPLQDLETLERPAGVMVRGLWLDAAEIQRRLDVIARKHDG